MNSFKNNIKKGFTYGLAFCCEIPAHLSMSLRTRTEHISLTQIYPKAIFLINPKE